MVSCLSHLCFFSLYNCRRKPKNSLRSRRTCKYGPVFVPAQQATGSPGAKSQQPSPCNLWGQLCVFLSQGGCFHVCSHHPGQLCVGEVSPEHL